MSSVHMQTNPHSLNLACAQSSSPLDPKQKKEFITTQNQSMPMPLERDHAMTSELMHSKY